MTLAPESPARTKRSTSVVVSALVALLVGVALGVVLDRKGSDPWLEGRGRIGDRQLSVDVEGWTYGASGSIPSWVDSAGTWHDSGWPDCLTGRAGSTQTIRFIAPSVDADGHGFRPI